MVCWLHGLCQFPVDDYKREVHPSLFALARFGLALAKDFLCFEVATIRFAALPRADLEVLRALPRAADFPLRDVGRFFL